jgi:hypothetical protein
MDKKCVPSKKKTVSPKKKAPAPAPKKGTREGPDPKYRV